MHHMTYQNEGKDQFYVMLTLDLENDYIHQLRGVDKWYHPYFSPFSIFDSMSPFSYTPTLYNYISPPPSFHLLNTCETWIHLTYNTTLSVPESALYTMLLVVLFWAYYLSPIYASFIPYISTLFTYICPPPPLLPPYSPLVADYTTPPSGTPNT